MKRVILTLASIFCLQLNGAATGLRSSAAQARSIFTGLQQPTQRFMATQAPKFTCQANRCTGFKNMFTPRQFSNLWSQYRKPLALGALGLGGAGLAYNAYALQPTIALAEESDNKKATWDLFNAISTGDIAQAKLSLQQGANLNAQGSDTPLTKAARKGNIDMVRLLLEQGADVNLTSSYVGRGGCGWQNDSSPLNVAVYQNNIALVKLFLEYGANVNHKFIGDRTVLMNAAGEGNKEIVKLLLDHKADVNARDAQKQTALFFVREYNVDIAKLLLERGLTLNTKDYADKLVRATATGDARMVKLLLEHGADVNIDSNRPLTTAVAVGNERMVKLLLQHGATVNDQMLQIASAKGDTEIIELLQNYKKQ